MTDHSLIGSYSAVVFDCGDTLLRMDPSRAEIFRDVAAATGIELLLPEVERAYEIVDFAIKMKSSVLKTEDAKHRFHFTINSALCDVLGIQRSLAILHPRLVTEFGRRRRWRPFPDVGEALGQLASRVPLYVLANWDANLPEVLRQANLEGFFREAISSEMLGYEKPERACFEAFLSRTSLDRSATIYVGNEYIADVIGARDAGLIPLLVDRSEKMRLADCVRVSSFTELTTALIGNSRE